MNCETYHIPVLFNKTIEGLNIQPDGIYVDLTFGGGGHSRGIVDRLTGKGHLYAFDQDIDAQKGEIKDSRFTFVRSNFRFLGNWMQYYGIEQVDGILADLGVSSHQLDSGERGFSFRYDAPLDMRMNQKARQNAQDIVQEYTEDQLADIFYLYGELKNSRKIASVIVQARKTAEITTTGQLANIVNPVMGNDRGKKDLARLFQALRIEVNGEMTALSQMLKSATKILRPGGRLVILTYHSLEDRMVKNIIRYGNIEGNDVCDDIYGRKQAPLKAVNRTVIVPDEEELRTNPRSRSAKLRIAEKQ